jgi:hypothetical protein
MISSSSGRRGAAFAAERLMRHDDHAAAPRATRAAGTERITGIVQQ